MTVETEVLDPGHSPTLERPSAIPNGGGCYKPVGSLAYQEVPHTWQLVSVDEHRSVWMCPVCRRVERRTFDG